MKTNFVIICIAIIFLSCTKNENNPKGKIYKINLETDYVLSHKDSLYNHIEIIPLQTDEKCLLAKPSQMIVCSDSSYVILDEINKSIFRFDKKGVFLNKIGQKGRGPGEYVVPKSVIDIENKKQIVVGDIGLQKLLVYSYEGKLIKEKRVNSSFRRLFYNQSQNKWWGYAGDARRISRNLKPDQRLKFIDLFADSEKDRFIFGHKSYGHVICEGFKCFLKNAELCYFGEPFNNHIYSFDGYSIETKYTFDFGKYNPISDDVDDYILEDEFPRKWLVEKDKKYVSTFDGFNEFDKYLYLSFFHNTIQYSFLIDKLTSKLYLLNKDLYKAKDVKITPEFFPHIAYSKNSCYSIISAHKYKRHINEIEVDENDNPIIIKYILNENN
ncbi:MAG: 6-bladed beta-propeller [Marinilabiliaceae bacterium]|nr:6-bladed beta-propeller [Marinilabiliaceae bacterium]